MNYIFDTNAVIDFICDVGNFEKISEKDDFYISFITYIELSVGFKSEQEKKITRMFVQKCRLVLIDKNIIDLTIDIRKKYKLKLPDTIISATAIIKNATLITSDKEILKKAAKIKLSILNPRI